MASELAQRLNERIDDLARHLLGEPNRFLSTREQQRFGSKGSIAVEIAGPKQGRWYDHEEEVGGDGLELVRRKMGHINGGALDWVRDWLGSAGSRIHAGPALARAGAIGGAAEKPDVDDNAAKVASIVSQCQEPAGTCAETYLRGRGITADLPECIRFRRNAFRGNHALVALATDANGAVQAVQQIYKQRQERSRFVGIDDDGWPVEKQTRERSDLH